MRLFQVGAALCASVLSASSAFAVVLEYDFHVNDPDIRLQEGGTAANEIRATFIEVEQALRLNSLGATMRAFNDVDIDASWTIYGSNANNDIVSTLAQFTADFSFSGLSSPAELISTSVDVTLAPGFYLLALQTDKPLFYTHYRETDTFRNRYLPYTTPDGAITVIEGGIINFASASDPTIIGGNVSLPAIQVDYDPLTAVPLPAGGVLLLSAASGLAFIRRRSQRKA